MGHKIEVTKELKRAALMAYPNANVHAIIENDFVIKGYISDYCIDGVGVNVRPKEDIGLVYPMGYADCQLLLTDLKDMSDEDLIEVAKMLYGTYESALECGFNKEWLLNIPENVSPYLIPHVIDFLRSKSYNLPFRDVDLVAAGIAVLTTRTTTNEKAI